MRAKTDEKFCCRVSQPSIMFSYKAQVDDAMDEDTVSLPHQQSFSSLKTDSDYIYQVHTPSIHMPLYGSQALKSSPSKHKSSLHSLASTKDSKTGSGHIYDSPVALYRSTSGIKSFSRRLSAEKSPSDFKKYPLTKSDNFIDSKNSSLDLKLTHHTWKSKSASQFKYGGPSSVSNLLFSPNTASSFLYKSGANDSNTNLFSLARKGSLMHERKRSEGNVSSQFFEIPPLENTLQSILDSSTNGSEVTRGTSSRESWRKDNTAARDSQNIEKKESSRLMQQTDAAVSEIDVEDTSDSIDASTVTQQLLSKPASSTSEEVYEKRKKKDTKRKESGGLSDYLLSLTISKDEKEEKDTEVDPSPFPSRHVKSYTQTESL